MRFLCLKVRACVPQSTPTEIAEVETAQDPREKLRLCEKLLDKGFVNLEVQTMRVAAYQQLGDMSGAARSLDLVTRMVGSILRGRDGKSPETAYDIISEKEQFIILAVQGLERFGPTVKGIQRGEAGKHTNYRWEVMKPPDNQSVVVFFNVDAFTDKSYFKKP